MDADSVASKQFTENAVEENLGLKRMALKQT